MSLNTEDLIMPYGKHKGEKICDVPTSYLQWAIREWSDCADELREEMENQIELRAGRGVQRRGSR
jgi:uncharacterized protein (DUF3820 family)